MDAIESSVKDLLPQTGDDESLHSLPTLARVLNIFYFFLFMFYHELYFFMLDVSSFCLLLPFLLKDDKSWPLFIILKNKNALLLYFLISPCFRGELRSRFSG